MAEGLGASMVAFDKSIRGNFSPERIQRQLAALPASDRQVLDGYAAGMNAWLARVRTQPGQLMPKEFNDLGFAPADWTAYDAVSYTHLGRQAQALIRQAGGAGPPTEETAMSKRAVIVGWSHVPFGKLDDPDTESLMARVSGAALAHCLLYTSRCV